MEEIIFENEKKDVEADYENIDKAKEVALKYLSYKNRTYREIVNKLNEKGYYNEVVENIMEFLQNYNYINDEKYAQNFIINSINIKGHGNLKIKYELKNKGISDEVIDKVFNSSDFDESELEKAEILLSKKLKSKDYDYKDKNRAYNYLLRRGFSYETINKVFSKLENQI